MFERWLSIVEANFLLSDSSNIELINILGSPTVTIVPFPTDSTVTTEYDRSSVSPVSVSVSLRAKYETDELLSIDRLSPGSTAVP